jgi:DNA-binding transcriptional LysR family regulator
METRYLRTLAVVAQTGSFSKTAQQLHITQSAVSQRIKWLEDHFGRELFNRTSTRLLLTDAGKVALEKAHEILALEDQMVEELENLEHGHPLRVSCTPTFGMIHLPQALNRFMLRNYEITDIQLLFHVPEQAMIELREGHIELAVIEHCGRMDFEEFATYPLPDDELVFVSAHTLNLPKGRCELSQLRSHTLYVRKEGCSSRSLLENNLRQRHLSLRDFRKTVVTDGLVVTIEAVRAGAGIAFISRSLVEKDLAEGILREHHVHDFNHQRNRTLVVNWNRRNDPAVKAFISCIFNTFNLPSPVENDSAAG